MNELSNITQDQQLIFEPQNLTKETIKKYLCPKATDQELLMGLQIAKTFNLNPLKREVYFVKYKDDEPMSVLTGYEVYLKRAERAGKYAGLETTTEGKVEDGSLKAICKVYRKDWQHPLVHEAYYSEYVQMKKVYKNGQFVGAEPNTFWKNKPRTMIKKVAESQAFRKAFPDEMDGIPYTSDEVIDVEAQEAHEKTLPINKEPEMPKLKQEPIKARDNNPQQAQEAVICDEPKQAEPKVESPVKTEIKLSAKSISNLNKAIKYLGAEMRLAFEAVGLRNGEDIKDDETADMVYQAAYKIYKSQTDKK